MLHCQLLICCNGLLYIMTTQPPDSQAPTQDINNPTGAVKKKEIAKAWLFTLLLHVLIAGGLIGYWYYNQHKNRTDSLALQLPKSAPQKTAVVASTVALPASTVTFTASTTVLTPVASAITPALVASVTASDAQRPLANYVAKQIVTKQATNQVLVTAPHIGIKSEPTTLADRALTARDLPTKPSAAKPPVVAEVSSKAAKTEANPIDAQDKSEPPVANVATSKSTSKSDASEVTVTTKAAEKQAVQLTKELDASNDQISELINQIKVRNQQQIDAISSTTSPAVTPSIASAASH